MTKTANHDEEKPTPPPADRALIKAWIEEGQTNGDRIINPRIAVDNHLSGHDECRDP